MFQSCNLSQNQADPVYILNRDANIAIQNKELHTKAINSVFDTYKKTTSNDINLINKRLDLCTHAYVEKLKEMFYLAVYGSKSKIQQLPIDEQISILTLRLSVDKEVLLQKDLIRKIQVISLNKYQPDLSQATLNSIQFLTQNRATASIENEFPIGPIEFIKEDRKWKINPIGNSYDKYKRDQLTLAQLRTTKEQYVNSALKGNGLNAQNSWVKLVDITKN